MQLKTKIKKVFSKDFFLANWQLIIVLVVAGVLRFTNLGYSNYQGDEIKALYLPEGDESFFEFLMDQRKGPVQFLVTFILKFINPTYENELLLRIPFVLAGFFSVYFFFKLVRMIFGKKIAFYSSLFLATNGFFIAFSRIVQYQSFVIFFMVLALYYLSLALKSEDFKIKGIYWGLIFWALSILSHYDGIFIAPFAFYLIYKWFRNANKQQRSHLLKALVIPALFVASFYVPFIFSISERTQEYWLGRITGDVSAKLSSSRYLFTVYQPIYVVHIYSILFVLGLGLIFLGLFSKHIRNIGKLPKFVQRFFTHTTDLMQKISNQKYLVFSLLAWIGIAVAFFEGLVYIPGTHIYTYLIPSFIILALGLVTLESLVFKIFEYPLVVAFNTIGISTLFAFLCFQSYVIFVDNRKEYPWEQEQFLIWTLPIPTPIYHLSMFGFPYYRNWEGIGDFISQFPEVEAYSTNERKSMARYYIPLEKGTEKAGFFVHVRHPQSFTENIIYEKADYWAQNYEPVHTLSRFGRDLVRVYLMEPGSLEEIQALGY